MISRVNDITWALRDAHHAHSQLATPHLVLIQTVVECRGNRSVGNDPVRICTGLESISGETYDGMQAFTT